MSAVAPAQSVRLEPARPSRSRLALLMAPALAGACIWLGSGGAEGDSSVQLAAGAAGRAALARANAAFGDDPIEAAIGADVAETVLTPASVDSLVAAERSLARLPGVKAVLGPGTLLQATASVTARVIDTELRAAGVQTPVSRARTYQQLLVRFGLSRAPDIHDHYFVDNVVFGGGVAPKPQLRWLFPDSQHAVILVLHGRGCPPRPLPRSAPGSQGSSGNI